MAWLWRLEAGHERELGRPRKRIIKPRACVVLLMVLTALWLLAVVWLFRPRLPEGVFRASAHIPSLNELLRVRRQVNQTLSRQMQLHPEYCGIASASIRIYEQYALIRTSPETTLTMVNLRVEPLEHTDTLTLQESSRMCDPSHSHTSRTRAKAVSATWRNEHYLVQTGDFIGTTAVCLQHWHEVMQGVWPCNTTSETLHIPRLPQDPSSSHEEL